MVLGGKKILPKVSLCKVTLLLIKKPFPDISNRLVFRGGLPIKKSYLHCFLDINLESGAGNAKHWISLSEFPGSLTSKSFSDLSVVSEIESIDHTLINPVKQT